MKFLFLLLLPLQLFSQIYTYTDNTAGVYSSIDTLISADTLTRVNGANKPFTKCSTGFTTSGWSKNSAFDLESPAIEFSIVPLPMAEMTVTGFAADVRRTVTGTVIARFCYSADLGKTWVEGADIIPKNGVCDSMSTFSFNIAAFTTTSTVIFRIYGYNAKASSGTIQLKNIIVSGSARWIDQDGDGYSKPEDCNDSNDSINPAATELCNNIDDNCNEQTDEGLPQFVYFFDSNGDGYGDGRDTSSCSSTAPEGFVTVQEPFVEVTITTTGKALNPWLHGLSFGDIWSDSKNKDRDIKAEPQYTNIKRLKLQNVQYPEGASSHHDKRIAGDTLGKNGVGMAYNFQYCKYNKPCAPNAPIYDESCMLYGIGCNTHPWSYFPYSVETMASLGIKKLDFYYNVRLNDYDATIDNLSWAESKGIEVRIELGDEYDLQGYDNPALLPNGVADYKTRVADAKSRFEVAGYKVFADGAEISRNSGIQVKWNTGLVGWPVYGINQYFKDNWIMSQLSPSLPFEQMLDSCRKATGETFPNQMDLFRAKFPGVKCAITSWGQSSGSLYQPYVNTLVAGCYVFWHYKSMVEYNLAHDDVIATASYYRGANLGLFDEYKWTAGKFTSGPKWAYNALYCIGKLQGESAIVYTVTTGNKALTGLATKSGSTYTIVLTNETSEATPINFIKADGMIKSVWTGESISSESLSKNAYLISPIVKSIPAYSIVYVQF